MGLATWSFMPAARLCLGILRHRQRGHGDDRQSGEAPIVLSFAAPRPMRANPPRRLEPVHHRHLNVHQHRVVVGGLLRHPGERFLAIHGFIDFNALAAQEFAGELAIDVVVLDQQQAGAGKLAAGGQIGRAGHGACSHRRERVRVQAPRGSYRAASTAIPV
jgi:hypothetical protein